MKKTRYEKLKEMSIEEVAELMKKLELDPCDLCPFGVEDSALCHSNKICAHLSDNELFKRYLEGKAED